MRQRGMQTKKGQLKMGESIIVLIIFFILLSGGMIFYAKIASYSNAQKRAEVDALDALSIEQRIRHLAELPCTIDASVVYDCYDITKVRALQEVLPENAGYYDSIIFVNSRVTFTTVYPDTEEIVLYEYAYADESSGVEPFRTPIVLYDPLTDVYNFGYITIEVYA